MKAAREQQSVQCRSGKTFRRESAAFTLLELLVVIGIVALLSTIGIGALRGFSAVDVVKAGNRQLLDDIGMARNHALNQRTTVYMVFVPMLQTLDTTPMTAAQRGYFTNRLGGQLTSYNFMTLRSPGDQPGKGRPRFLSEWRHLPDGVYISAEEMIPLDPVTWMARAAVEDGTGLPLPRFSIPFPTTDSSRTNQLPCVAFNYRGELLGADPTKPRPVDEYLSLTRGSIIYGRDSKGLLNEPPELIETPRGNTTNNPYIRIDRITGRARMQDRKEPKA